MDAVLEDYEAFSWRGIDFHVLPAKGHTFGSVHGGSGARGTRCWRS